ncbi:ADP-ribosylation factor-like protein 13A isoform X2 [Salvelinus namaycush]|uniref:ADP-ribosylation factor-like protein 13A isoform X2 n=1 Tax=Salvelinus namaycush TaxID=8040 RepID=A0A8U0QSM0_SALNM|nr:ADP-ribosylation factor-like protein 13A isoform X2 [Salvelinus namaycush]
MYTKGSSRICYPCYGKQLKWGLRRRWLPLCSPCSVSPQLNMFNLMTNCCSWVSKIQQPIRKVNVLVVGLDKAGKTSTVRGMLRVPPVDVGPTHGCVRTELRVENFLVTLLDISGAPEVRGSWRDLYGEVHGFIFVVDSSDRQRIKEVKELLTDLLKQPRVAGKPLLVLANKQDKMNALLGSEIIELLSLERLVNQSRSLCHIEPCSALIDLRRWTDRKTLRGLRWLLRAVNLDYPELCSRIIRDIRDRRPLAPDERDRRGKIERSRKPKEERIRASKNDLRKVQSPQEKDLRPKTPSLQPIRNILKKESTLKKRLHKKKKQQVKIKDTDEKSEGENAEEEEGEEGSTEADPEPSVRKEKANSPLIPPKRRKLKRKAKVKEETQDLPESVDNEDKDNSNKGDKKKKKKKVVKVKKNRINSEKMPGAYSQPVDLSATFDLYRKAILALKERHNQGQ